MGSLLDIVEVKDFKGGLVEGNFNGKFLMFEEPLERGEEYFLGVDVGSGKGLTNSVVHVLRRGSINGPDVQAGEYACNTIDPFALAKVVYTLGNLYYCHSWDLPAMACVEINNYGIGTVRCLAVELGYPHMFQAEDYDAAERRYVTTMGFNTTPSTRKAIVTFGESQLRNKRWVVHSPMFIEEMASFDTAKALGAYDRDQEAEMVKEIVATGRHRPGAKDDRLMAGFIAEWTANESRVTPVMSEEQKEINRESRSSGDYRNMALTANEVIEWWEREW